MKKVKKMKKSNSLTPQKNLSRWISPVHWHAPSSSERPATRSRNVVDDIKKNSMKIIIKTIKIQTEKHRMKEDSNSLRLMVCLMQIFKWFLLL
jgi:hypothetical protein